MWKLSLRKLGAVLYTQYEYLSIRELDIIQSTLTLTNNLEEFTSQACGTLVVLTSFCLLCWQMILYCCVDIILIVVLTSFCCALRTNYPTVTHVLHWQMHQDQKRGRGERHKANGINIVTTQVFSRLAHSVAVSREAKVKGSPSPARPITT